MQHHLEWLGFEVKDKISGATGVVSSISFDLSGCVQADVRPKVDPKTGEMKTGWWFDVTRLEKISKKRLMEIPASASFSLASAAPSGPMPKSPRR